MPNLLPFCGIEGSYETWHVPQTLGGWTYATNGKIAVRVPTTDPDTIGPDGRVEGSRWPDASKLAWPTPNEADWTPYTDWTPWPLEPNYTLGEECAACEQMATKGICQTCDGSGEIDCEHCGHGGECWTCDGSGLVEGRTKSCVFCDGRDADMLPRAANVGEHQIDIVLDAAIRTLGAVVWRKGLPALQFMFGGGGQGIVMPINSK